jgi:hypothetical protein
MVFVFYCQNCESRFTETIDIKPKFLPRFLRNLERADDTILCCECQSKKINETAPVAAKLETVCVCDLYDRSTMTNSR